MPGVSDYTVVFSTSGLADLERQAIRLSTTLDADGAPAQASLVRKAYFDLLAELRAIARDISLEAEREIKDAEQATRVRPDTGGGGGPRLNDFVGESHPLFGVEGAVGVNYEPILDANVPWWPTNEFGSDARVGDVVKGYFFEAGRGQGFKPAQSRFRQEPLFGATGAVGPEMHIKRPIPDRRFVKRGAERAEHTWHGLVRASRARFMSACTSAVAAAPPPRLKGAPRGRRRR